MVSNNPHTYALARDDGNCRDSQLLTRPHAARAAVSAEVSILPAIFLQRDTEDSFENFGLCSRSGFGGHLNRPSSLWFAHLAGAILAFRWFANRPVFSRGLHSTDSSVDEDTLKIKLSMKSIEPVEGCGVD